MKWAKKLKIRLESCLERKRNRDRRLCLNFPQGIEMNSVEVVTPTSSVVSLSPQDDITTQNDELNEQQMQCSVKSDRRLTIDLSQKEKFTARIPFHLYASYRDNALQEPLLKLS